MCMRLSTSTEWLSDIDRELKDIELVGYRYRWLECGPPKWLVFPFISLDQSTTDLAWLAIGIFDVSCFLRF